MDPPGQCVPPSPGGRLHPAVPWELVDAPSTIGTVPRLINPPEQYDEAGQPRDPDEARRWADETAYAAMVREAEKEAHADHRLSDRLVNRDAQDLAGIIHLFALGTMGLYGRALDYLESNWPRETEAPSTHAT